MKFGKRKTDVLSEERKQEIIQRVNEAQAGEKAQAITEAMESVAAEACEQLTRQILEEAERTRTDEAFKASLGLRALSQEEQDFYQKIKAGPQMGVTASQIDILPTQIIDRTLEDIQKDSGILELINFAHAGVKKWLFGSATGAAVWGALTADIDGELAVTITGENLEVFKLTAYIVIPKAIRDLELGYVDKYFRAKLQEAMHAGIVDGYLNGDGKTAPIGITKKIATVNAQGQHTAKTVLSTLTGFTPAQIAPVAQTLSHSGKRTVDRIYLICNPMDAYQYVFPAMYGDSLIAGWVDKSFIPMTVIQEPGMTQGKGALTLKGKYTMGFSGVKVDEYRETKALEDADLFIGKVYANGRADDDDCAVIFDVTQLAPYISSIHTETDAAEESSGG